MEGVRGVGKAATVLVATAIAILAAPGVALGADRYVDTSLSVASAAGATAIRAANRNGFAEGDTIKVDTGANQEIRVVDHVINPNPSSPNPNVVLTEALNLPHPAGAVLSGGTLQSGVGFQPDYEAEG